MLSCRIQNERNGNFYYQDKKRVDHFPCFSQVIEMQVKRTKMLWSYRQVFPGDCTKRGTSLIISIKYTVRRLLLHDRNLSLQ